MPRSIAWVSVLLISAGCSSAASEGAALNALPPSAPSSSAVSVPSSSAPSSTEPAPSSAAPNMISAPSSADDASGESVELILPDGDKSLLESLRGFPEILHGKALKLGSEGPAVVALQTMLLAWNYDLDPADVTGRYDEKTGRAVLSYRIDLGLSEVKQKGDAAIARQARSEGILDDKAFAMFVSRLRAKSYRSIRAIDPIRGIEVHVPATATAKGALNAVFPDEQQRRRALGVGEPIVVDTSDPKLRERGEKALWIPLRTYACANSTLLRAEKCIKQ